jgi:predicted kinase
VISSDVVRKEVAGISSNEEASAGWQEGIYVPETTSLVYCTMLERATHALRVGESVVLDASWTDAGVRELAARVAEETSVDLMEIMCTTEPCVAYQRIGNRILGGANASDATAQIARRMKEEADAWPSACRVDTTYSLRETMNVVRKVIEGQSSESEVPNSDLSRAL